LAGQFEQVFSQNRERLLKAEVARASFEEVGELARDAALREALFGNAAEARERASLALALITG
jgi:hypothetical protein